jgi:outer membrane protein TolC
MREQHRLIFLFITALLLPSLVVAEDNVHDSAFIGANVQELLQWADTHNYELSAMRYEVDAASERIVPAGALPDPILRTELRDFAGPGAPSGFNPLPGQGGGTKYTLMQSFPLWGKRELRTEVATAELVQVQGRRQVALAELHAQIKSEYAQYYLTFGLKKLNDEILHLLSDLEAVTQVRYSSGLAPQQDVIRAQIEKTTLRSENITLDMEQHHTMTRLNTALARPQHSLLSAPEKLRHFAPEKLNGAILHDKLLRNNPILATQSAQISVAEANKRLVDKNRYPDVTLGIAPIQRGGSIDSWEAMVEFNIPIRMDTRRAQESEAGARLDAAKQRQQAASNLADGELQEYLAAYESAEKQVQLIDNTLLPQAELTFHSALTGYETGKVDFATLLDAQRAIKRAKVDKIKAEVEQALRIADIEKMVGEEL